MIQKGSQDSAQAEEWAIVSPLSYLLAFTSSCNHDYLSLKGKNYDPGKEEAHTPSLPNILAYNIPTSLSTQKHTSKTQGTLKMPFISHWTRWRDREIWCDQSGDLIEVHINDNKIILHLITLPLFMQRTGKVYCPRNSFPARKPWFSTTKRTSASSGTWIINVNVSFHLGLNAEI